MTVCRTHNTVTHGISGCRACRREAISKIVQEAGEAIGAELAAIAARHAATPTQEDPNNEG